MFFPRLKCVFFIGFRAPDSTTKQPAGSPTSLQLGHVQDMGLVEAIPKNLPDICKKGKNIEILMSKRPVSEKHAKKV